MDRTILLVDVHPVIRQGILRLAEKEPGLSVCGEAEDAHQALALIEKHQPSLVVLDLSLKESSGFDLLRDVKKRWPDLPILVLSMYDEEVYAQRLLWAGASGYIMKQEAPKKVIEAIWAVLGGSIYVSEKVATAVLAHRAGRRASAKPIMSLSDRELQVFQGIGEGLTHQRIAEALGISVKTIESHVEHIKAKLGFGSGRELLQRAVEWVLYPERF